MLESMMRDVLTLNPVIVILLYVIIQLMIPSVPEDEEEGIYL